MSSSGAGEGCCRAWFSLSLSPARQRKTRRLGAKAEGKVGTEEERNTLQNKERKEEERNEEDKRKNQKSRRKQMNGKAKETEANTEKGGRGKKKEEEKKKDGKERSSKRNLAGKREAGFSLE